MTIDDSHLFASRLQDSSHTQLTSQGVTIGTDMAGKKKTLVGFHQRDKKGPVYCHRNLDSSIYLNFLKPLQPPRGPAGHPLRSVNGVALDLQIDAHLADV